jgi:hypothetical protein
MARKRLSENGKSNIYIYNLSCCAAVQRETVGESFVANNLSSTFKMEAVVLPKPMYLFT